MVKEKLMALYLVGIDQEVSVGVVGHVIEAGSAREAVEKLADGSESSASYMVWTLRGPGRRFVRRVETVTRIEQIP